MRLAQAPKPPGNGDDEYPAAHDKGDQTLQGQVPIQLGELGGNAGALDVELGDPDQPIIRADVKRDVDLKQRHRSGVRRRRLFGQENARQGNGGKKAADGLQTVQRWQAIGREGGFLHLIGECPDKPPFGIEEPGRDDSFESRCLEHHRQ